jgi:hypothetical protein
VRIEKYTNRLWVLWDIDGSMIAVFAYKKGAENVRDIILSLRYMKRRKK